LNDWFLGIIAISVLVMAVLQIGAVIMLARVAKRVLGVTEDLQREIKPLVAKVNAIADEAQRAASLATKQIERVDAMVGDVSRRVHDTTAAIQSIVTGPLRQGSAVVSGLRAVIAALLTTPPRPAADRDEEEDALFVG
jgi:hypothetical protein